MKQTNQKVLTPHDLMFKKREDIMGHKLLLTIKNVEVLVGLSNIEFEELPGTLKYVVTREDVVDDAKEPVKEEAKK